MTKETSDDGENEGSDDRDCRTWSGDGWTARVMKNEDDEGWAVAMTADGASEPSLVGPWTMGRDKKNPKPLDVNSFAVLLRGANEILARHEAQRRASLHRSVTTESSEGRRRVDLDIVPDDEDPHAILTVFDSADTVLSRTRVAPNFKLTSETARKWLDEGGAEG